MRYAISPVEVRSASGYTWGWGLLSEGTGRLLPIEPMRSLRDAEHYLACATRDPGCLGDVATADAADLERVCCDICDRSFPARTGSLGGDTGPVQCPLCIAEAEVRHGR